MAERKRDVTRAQEKAKAYLDEMGVEKVISEMLNSLVHARDPQPTIFMVSKRVYILFVSYKSLRHLSICVCYNDRSSICQT